jgi:hypothetical protein
MVYYRIQSWQRDSDGKTTGEDVLTEESGNFIPENSTSNYTNGCTITHYFSTYEEARAYLDLNLSSYYKYNTPASIVLRDEVKGETRNYSGY